MSSIPKWFFWWKGDRYICFLCHFEDKDGFCIRPFASILPRWMLFMNTLDSQYFIQLVYCASSISVLCRTRFDMKHLYNVNEIVLCVNPLQLRCLKPQCFTNSNYIALYCSILFDINYEQKRRTRSAFEFSLPGLKWIFSYLLYIGACVVRFS